MSPQLLMKSQYTNKSDIWSLGLIYFEILFGKTPWQADNIFELLEKVHQQPIKFPENINISNSSKNFILSCLKVEENERINWKELFNHEIFQREKKILIEIENIGIGIQKQTRLLTTRNQLTSNSQKKEPFLFRNRSSSNYIPFEDLIKKNITPQIQPKKEESSQSTNCNSNSQEKMAKEKQNQKNQYYLGKNYAKLNNYDRNHRTQSNLDITKQVNITQLLEQQITKKQSNRIFPKKNLSSIFIQGDLLAKKLNTQASPTLKLKKRKSTSLIAQVISKNQQNQKNLLMKLILASESYLHQSNVNQTVKQQAASLFATHKKIINLEMKNFGLWNQAKKIIYILAKEVNKEKKDVENFERIVFLSLLSCYYNLLKIQTDHQDNEILQVDRNTLEQIEAILLMAEGKKAIQMKNLAQFIKTNLS